MGLFDKLFSGGAKQPDPASTPASTPSSPAPGGANPPVARRERSKPQVAGAVVPAGEDQAGENIDLLAAISAVVAGDTPETRAALYAVLLTSELFLVSMPGEGDANLPAGEVTLQEGQQLSLATIRSPEGQIFLPAFTDTARLAHSLPEGEKARFIRIGASAVCRMFLQGGGEGIVINPGQPPSGMITRAEAQVLANGAVPQLDENGQMIGHSSQQMKITIGKPETPPDQTMIDAILAEAPKHPIVREVHIFKAGIEEQPPRLMIGLYVNDGLAPEQLQETFKAIGMAAYEARGGTEQFDMMPLNEQLLEAIRPLEVVVYLRDQQA